jgi:hypothetical protein
MRVLLVITGLVFFVPTLSSAANDPACGDRPCCPTAACCTHEAPRAEFESTEPVQAGVLPAGFEWPAEAPERRTREYAKVLFLDPVKIGNRVLIGPYVIEHDTERMAQGRPCTHIYAADDVRLPVVAFHCHHLDRKANPKATVTLRRLPDGSTRMFQLLEFQFAGSTEGHGVPSGR